MQIPRSNDGKDWWEYIDPTVNKTMLDGMDLVSWSFLVF